MRAQLQTPTFLFGRKALCYPLNGSLGGSRGRSAHGGYEKNHLHAVNLTPNRPTFTAFAVRTTLSRLQERLKLDVKKCPTICNNMKIILSVNCSTGFGWFLHSSSGTQITLSTESGTRQTLLLPVAIVEELRQICVCWSQHTQLCVNSPTTATGSSHSWLVRGAVDRVICASDDGWRSHSKHVIALVDEWKTNLLSLAILFHSLCAQHVSDINISIFRSLRLCW